MGVYDLVTGLPYEQPTEQRKAVPMQIASYSEASYFDGFAFAHIAAYEEERRLTGIRKRALQAVERERRRNGRARFN